LFSEGRFQNPTICWDIRVSRATHRVVRSDVYDSDNVTGDADNQQERLGSAEAANWFLAGFIEGEGSLCVGVKRHPTCRSGYYVDPGFFLYQHRSGLAVLQLARETFGSGRISPKSGSDTVLTYEISSTTVLRERVVPFFEQYVVPYSAKVETFERFREILEMMERGLHRRPPTRARADRGQGLCNEPVFQGSAPATSARARACENPQRPYVGHPPG
jgi:hypothetical protein